MKKLLLVLMIVVVTLAGAASVNHYLTKRGERAAQANSLLTEQNQKAKATAQINADRDRDLINAKTTNVKLCVFIEQYYTSVRLPANVKSPTDCVNILAEKDCPITPATGSTTTTVKGVCEEFAN